MNTQMFQINAVLVNGQEVPYAYSFTQQSASFIAQRLREEIYGSLASSYIDFRVKAITAKLNKFSSSVEKAGGGNPAGQLQEAV